MARIEVIRDRWPEDRNGAEVWVDNNEKAYNEWLNGDPDTPRDKPEPSFKLATEDVNQLVIGWLRGPEGATGPPGMMGPSAR